MIEVKGYSDIQLIHDGQKHMVLKAFNDQKGKIVALKTSSKELPSNNELINIEMEYEYTQAANIDGVPQAYSLIDTGHKKIIEMEYIDALSVKSIIKKRKLSLVEVLSVFENLVSILDNLHKEGIIHRDINPNNILWMPESNQVYLIDLGSALKLLSSKTSGIVPKVIEGTHSYMSPEQTGRTGQLLDYRTDFYSLGVSMYEILTGKLPFETKDINEMIHLHMAVDPISPNRVSSLIPKVVSDLVMKCLSKDPNQRYQSSRGLHEDIKECHKQILETGTIETFGLGLNDNIDKFEIPTRLYGRKEELKKLKNLYGKSADENVLVFISGHPGVGKTSVVHEFDHWLRDQSGKMIYGKYDQYSRNVPYSAIIQAFTVLINQILICDNHIIYKWREKILEAVGVNGDAITQVIPELEILLGKQKPLPERDFEEMKTRFKSVFYDFIEVFGDSDNPLVIFLDDLQWVDNSSLGLIETLGLTNKKSGIMFIGSFRDNEVVKTHPVNEIMESLVTKGVNINKIHLEVLPTHPVKDLIKDVFKLPEKELEELSDELYVKTKGNPLFLKTILALLHEEGKIHFNHTLKLWEWDIRDINRVAYSEDIIEIMKMRINHLKPETIEMLKVASCIGNVVDVNILADYFNCTKDEVKRRLLSAIESGLIIDNTLSEKRDTLEFTHDRIQQASYALIPEALTFEIHLDLGRKMHTRFLDTEIENRLFEVVYQYSKGLLLVDETNEKIELANLFYRTGQKARYSVAFEEAAQILSNAKGLLSDQSWEEHYDLAINIHLALSEACYLTFDYVYADELNAVIESQATTNDDLLKLYKLMSKQYHQQTKYQEAIEISYKGLKLLGVDLPTADDALMAYFGEEQARVNAILSHRSIQSFVTMPENEENTYVSILEFLLNLYADSYLVGKDAVLAVTSVLMARLAMENGNNQYTSIAYVYYASTLCAIGVEYERGHELGVLAVQLAEKYEVQTIQNYTYHVFCLAVNHWKKPLHSSYEYWTKASNLQLASGSPYSGYVYLQLAHVLFAMGRPLDEVNNQIDKTRDFLMTMGHEGTNVILQIIVEQSIKCLRGQTESALSLDDDTFNTDEFLKTMGVYPFFRASYDYTRLRINYLMGDTLSYDDLCSSISVIEATQQGQIILADSYMFYLLHLINLIGDVDSEKLDLYTEKIESGIEKISTWSTLCEHNFMHKYLFIQAEYKKYKSELCEVIDLYDRSIDLAIQEKFIQDAAVFCEKAGEFWMDKSKSHLARPYIEKAYVLYERWGATAKLEQLESQYKVLLKSVINSADGGDSYFTESTDSLVKTSSFSDKLDFLSVIKASQAISKHIEIDDLSNALTAIAVENAGASKGLFILEEEDTFVIKAVIDKANKEKSLINIGQNYLNSNALSQAIVNYAIRVKKDVVLDHATLDEQFSSCPYIQKQNLDSVCCLPIIQNDKIRGLIYLENESVVAAFKKDRIKIIHILATQATISMENAKVYQDLEDLNKSLESKVRERTYELYEKNELLNETNQELERISTTDQLTNIFNRRYMESKLEKEISLCERYNRSLYVILLDVDYFKQVNDTYGHEVGDQVLIKIAEVMKQQMRVTDSLGRWGGEEFLIIAPEQGEQVVFADRIRSAIEEINHSGAGHVTASLGIAVYKPGDSTSRIVSRADICLYRAKAEGRNKVVCDWNE